MEDDHKWLKYENSLDQSTFVQAGNHHDDSVVYIGRVHHEGEIIPGKIITKNNLCCFCYDGKEITTSDFEVLTKQPEDEFKWIKSENGKNHANAIIGGKSKNGENYLIGRAKHLWLTIPGQIVPSEKCLYIPCDGKQIKMQNYEILVKKSELDEISQSMNEITLTQCSSDVKWVPYTPSMDKSNFIYTHIDLDGTDLCIGRVHYEGELIPGKIRIAHDDIHFCYNGEEIAINAVEKFDTDAISLVDWMRSGCIKVPTGFEVLIREPEDEYEWIKSEDGKIPMNAVVGGKSKSCEIYYVGRAKHLDLIIPGHIVPSKKCIFIPYGWKQHEKNEYEVLVKKAKSYSEPQPIFSKKNPIFGSKPPTGWQPPVFDSKNPPFGWQPPPFCDFKRFKRGTTDSPFMDATKKTVEWIHWSPGKSWPHNAVPAGIFKEGDFNKFQYIARRRHNDNMILGYAYINGPFYSGYQGNEISHGDFELLIENSEIFPKETL